MPPLSLPPTRRPPFWAYSITGAPAPPADHPLRFAAQVALAVVLSLALARC